ACPEMAIGLPAPRPALRLVKSEEKNVILKFSDGREGDLTQEMVDFSTEYLSKTINLSGYIVCKNSPSCGLERVRVYDSVGNGNKKSGIGLFTDFHARYKLLLLAHSQPLYRELGRLVANNKEWNSIESFFIEYRNNFMKLLQNQATRRNHTNVLMHIQGYFKRYLTSNQRQALSKLILEYRQGIQPLLAPLTLITHYLSEY
ncbi:YbgA family protein, partial [Klebsiella pneumoniae]|uniref:YbgA family protein n=1 Tax=Klebsiella pneumoniae TaxID=573 RepID=UPI000E35369E